MHGMWRTVLVLVPVLAACGGDDSPPAGPCPDCEAPAESDALFSFLQAGQYNTWTAESAVHASVGPHDNVRVYLGPKMAAGAAPHAIGSAVVKELYAGGATVTGWVVWVKVAADSAGGDGIYWYENFSTTSNDPQVEGVGDSACTGCHASGQDFLLTSVPLM